MLYILWFKYLAETAEVDFIAFQYNLNIILYYATSIYKLGREDV